MEYFVSRRYEGRLMFHQQPDNIGMILLSSQMDSFPAKLIRRIRVRSQFY